ncbi:MAG TPA: NUDIX hydrolase [Saprospiraceae bacterium]|nr:NUDIX hydrolase [Saprospiraceae bacterium]
MKIDIISDEVPFDEFFNVRKTKLRFENFDGTMSEAVTRYSFEKTDAIAVLVYHRSKDAYILVRQFRFPLVQHKIDPWMTEIVAGGISEGENEVAAAQREVIEETGYSLISIEKISFFYVSPGILNERIHLFLGNVDESSRINAGGGVKHEDEDIELVWIPRSEAMRWLEKQTIGDAKTIVALQWHFRKGLDV